MLPEVVLFAKLYDMCRVNANLVYPDFSRFVVFFINRNPKLFLRDFHYLCKELPRPGSSLMLKVVSKREVTKHLKKCTVTCSLTNTFNIRCSYTLLTSCNSASGRFFCKCEPFFHRRHTRVNQKQTCIVFRHK